MKKFKRVIASFLLLSLMVQPLYTYADRGVSNTSTTGKGSGDISLSGNMGKDDVDLSGSISLKFDATSLSDIIFVEDCAVLFPMLVNNINKNLFINNENMQKVLESGGYIEAVLPHVTEYTNTNLKNAITVNSNSDSNYKESAKWLSENNYLHLPETVTFEYEQPKVKPNQPTQPDKDEEETEPPGTVFTASSNGGTPEDVKTVQLKKGTYQISYNFLTVPDRMLVYLDGKEIANTGLVKGSSTINFKVDKTAQLEIVMNEGDGEEGTMWNYIVTALDGGGEIAPPKPVEGTKYPNNTDTVVKPKITYNNIYKDANAQMPKYLFLMNLMKVVDGVEYSRPLMVNSVYTRKVGNNFEQHVVTELADMSPYAKQLGKTGIDVTGRQTLLDYTHFGTRQVFVSPNVPELYIAKALDSGVIKLNDLATNLNEKTPIAFPSQYLASKLSGESQVLPPYSQDLPPVLSNYPKDFNPMGIMSNKTLSTERLESLDSMGLLPQTSNFNTYLENLTNPDYIALEGSFLGQSYTYTDQKTPTTPEIGTSLIEVTNIEDYVNTNTSLKPVLEGLSEETKSSPFENDIAQVKEIKAKGVNEVKYFREESISFIDALRLAYDTIKIYAEPTLTQLEIDTVNSLFGVSLQNVKEEDKEMVQYMYAKGIINPEESTFINFYEPLSNETALSLLYRIANEDARYTIKGNVTPVDTEMLDRGYSQIEGTLKNAQGSIPKEVRTTASEEQIIYIRLEELYLKDKQGRSYNKNTATENLTYNPSDYNITNNTFGLWDSSMSLMTFNPSNSPYYLGHLQFDYVSEKTGEPRTVIWMKYSLPEGFVESGERANINFNSGGNGGELPTYVSNFSANGGAYLATQETKLNYLGASKDYDLRNGEPIQIKGRGELKLTEVSKTSTFLDSRDYEDYMQLHNYLYPNSSNYDAIMNGQSSNSRLKPRMISWEQRIKNLLVLEAHANEATPPATNTNTNTNTQIPKVTNTVGLPCVISYDSTKAGTYRLAGKPLFKGTGSEAKLNPEVTDLLSKDKTKEITATVTKVDDESITVSYKSSKLSSDQLTFYMTEMVKTTIPSDGSQGAPVSNMYIKFNDGEDIVLINEDALPKFNVKVFKDSDSNTKVLQNTKTGVYAILSDGTNTAIIGNEFIHYPDYARMIEITDDTTYYNFEIIKKLFSYDSISKIDTEINGNNLVIFKNEQFKVTENTSTSILHNGDKIKLSPTVLKSTTDNYLNLNTLGYGAGYVIRTWYEGNVEHSVLIEFKRDDLYDVNITASEKTYGRYNDMLEDYYNTVFKSSVTASVNLALSNLALHWAMYNTDMLNSVTTISENYITNPFVRPSFTYFVDGVKTEIQTGDALEQKMYSEMTKISSITSLGSARYNSGNTLTISEILEPKTFLKGTYSSENRKFKFDDYRNSLCVALPATLGDIKIEYGGKDAQGNPLANTLKLTSENRYLGRATGEVPLYYDNFDEFYKSGTPKNTYQIGGTPVSVSGPIPITDESGAQFVYLSLHTQPQEIGLTGADLKPSKETSGVDYDVLFSKFQQLYPEYPFKQKDLTSGSGDNIPFITDKADKAYFITPLSTNTALVSRNSSESFTGIVLLRNISGEVKPYEYYYYGVESNRAVIGKQLNASDLKLDKYKDAPVFVSYSYLVGINDLYTKTTSANSKPKELFYAKPTHNYIEEVAPVTDITNMIAKNLLAKKRMESGGNVETNDKIYLHNLNPGDVVIFPQSVDNGSSEFDITDLGVVVDNVDANKYVPIALSHKDINTAQVWVKEAIASGRTRITLDFLLKKKLKFPSSLDLPFIKIIDPASVQIAPLEDVNQYFNFLNYAKTYDLAQSNKSINNLFQRNSLALYSKIQGAFELSNKDSKYVNADSIFVQDTESNKLVGVKVKNSVVEDKVKELGKDDTGNFLTRVDVYPYLQIEWVADYTSSSDGKSKSIYKVVDIDVANSQNATAYSDYSDYLRTDINNLMTEDGKIKLWDKYFTEIGVLNTDDLDKYISSSQPDFEAIKNESEHGYLRGRITVGQVKYILSVLILLYFILLFFMYVFATFSLGRMFIHGFKIDKYLTFGRVKNIYEVSWKKGIITTFFLCLAVCIVSYDGTWQLLIHFTNSIVEIIGVVFNDIYDIFTFK